MLWNVPWLWSGDTESQTMWGSQLRFPSPQKCEKFPYPPVNRSCLYFKCFLVIFGHWPSGCLAVDKVSFPKPFWKGFSKRLKPFYEAYHISLTPKSILFWTKYTWILCHSRPISFCVFWNLTLQLKCVQSDPLKLYINRPYVFLCVRYKSSKRPLLGL